MDRPSASLRQRLRNATIEAMLDSAEQAMVRKGYDHATMQQIAVAAGCATGTVYLYFKNKEELFQAIVARHAKVLFDIGAAAMAQSDDPLEKLRLSCAAMLRYTLQHRPFFRMFFTAMPMRHRALGQKLGSAARQKRGEYNRMELEVLRQAQSQGRIRNDLPAEAIQDFMDAVSFSMIEHFVFSTDKQAPEQQMNVLWGFITGGIGANGSGHACA